MSKYSNIRSKEKQTQIPCGNDKTKIGGRGKAMTMMNWRTVSVCGAMMALSGMTTMTAQVGAYDASMAKPIAAKAPVTMTANSEAPDIALPQGSSTLATTHPAQGEAQQKNDIFDGTEKFAQGASDVTDVNLNSKMLGMMSKGKGTGKMDLVVVHTFTYDKPGMYRMEDVQAYSQKLQGGDWNCFVHVREQKSGESTDICSRGQGEMNEMVIITAEPKELTFVHLRGKMSLDDLQHWDDSKHGDKSDKD